jgi:hypothetical protein
MFGGQSSFRNPTGFPSVKAPEGWRTPGRFAQFASRRQTLRVLDCGGPPPLFGLRQCQLELAYFNFVRM